MAIGKPSRLEARNTNMETYPLWILGTTLTLIYIVLYAIYSLPPHKSHLQLIFLLLLIDIVLRYKLFNEL